MIRRSYYALAALLWGGVIFLVSSIPDLQTDLPTTFDLILRKAAHIVEYIVLAALVCRALGRRYKLWHTVLIGILYAASDEWHQTFVPGRTGALTDLGIDGIGVVLGTLLAARTQK